MSANDFVTTLQSGLKTLAEQQLQQHGSKVIDMAIDGGMKFFQKYAFELNDWKEQVSEGDMDEDDLRWLLQSRDDLVDLEALKTQGLAKVVLDEFVNGIIEVIITAAKAVP